MKLNILIIFLAFLFNNTDSQTLKVILLGTGNPGPVMSGYQTCALIETDSARILLDAGRGTYFRLKEAGKFRGIDHVFLTHLHSDHVVALPDFWLFSYLFYPRNEPMKVFGPEGTDSMCYYLEKAFSFDIKWRIEDGKKNPAGAPIDSKDIDEGFVFEHKGLTIKPFKVDHYPVEPVLGYRIEYNGHSVVFSADTRYCENLIKHAQGADVLIHEVSYMTEDVLEKDIEYNRIQRIQAHHTHPIEAAEVFTKVQPRLAVYYHIGISKNKTLADLIEITKKGYSGDIIAGKDLMTIEIGDEIMVSSIEQ